MNDNIKIKGFKKTVNKCNVCMIVLFFTLSILIEVQRGILKLFESDISPILFEIIDSLSYSAVYFFSFVFPIVIFKLMSRKTPYYPLPAAPVLPRHAVKLCFAATSIVFTFSLLNSQIINIIAGLFGRTIDMSLLETEINGIHSIVLSFVMTAVVPALCEEFLFRGVFLKNLLPYGKTVAVVVSSLYFALMHQNLFQFLYTFAAGLAFGYIFIRTGSIWCGVLAHFLNNFLSVLSETLSFYLNDDAMIKIQYLMYVIIVFVGIVGIVLILKDEKKRDKASELRKGSVFGVTEEIPVFDSDTKLADKEAAKAFFTPLTWVVIALALIDAIWVFSLLTAPITY